MSKMLLVRDVTNNELEDKSLSHKVFLQIWIQIIYSKELIMKKQQKQRSNSQWKCTLIIDTKESFITLIKMSEDKWASFEHKSEYYFI